MRNFGVAINAAETLCSALLCSGILESAELEKSEESTLETEGVAKVWRRVARNG